MPRPHDFFPFETIRPVQELALNSWEKAVEKDKQYAIFEYPAGSGKSGIAYSCGKWAETQQTAGYEPGAYILTTQKSLQTQYLRDFAERGMVEMKGKANYNCATHGTDCATGTILNEANKSVRQQLLADGATEAEMIEAGRKRPSGCGGKCPYTAARKAFDKASLGVTNFSFFLATNQSGKPLKPRELLIIDEAHNTESALLSFVEIEVTRQRAKSVEADMPPLISPGDLKTAREYVGAKLYPCLDRRLTELIAESFDATEPEDRLRAAKGSVALGLYIHKLDSFLDKPDSNNQDWFASTDTATGALKIRPLTASEIAESHLFKMGRRTLFLSATILSPVNFCAGLGIDQTSVGIRRVDSEFPVENRMVHIVPVGHMSYAKIEATLPRMVKAVSRILTRHPLEKGIIHTHSYRIQKALVDYLQGTEHNERLLFHDNKTGAREQCIAEHLTSPNPTVLISPSMTEGLDLSEDLSRFQILVKVPYPFMGDPFVVARDNRDKTWTNWQTALTLMQATGRSIRSREDRAITYILDSDIDKFLERSGDILPQWWKDALTWE